MANRPIKIGARYQDDWGRIWFVVCYDIITNKWLMRLCDYPNEDYFKAEVIQKWRLKSY